MSPLRFLCRANANGSQRKLQLNSGVAVLYHHSKRHSYKETRLGTHTSRALANRLAAHKSHLTRLVVKSRVSGHLYVRPAIFFAIASRLDQVTGFLCAYYGGQ